LSLIKGQVEDVISISNLDFTAILDKLIELQNFIGTLSIQDGPIASAHVILLTVGVVIFLGVAGEAFFKKTGASRCCIFDDSRSNNSARFWSNSTRSCYQIVPYFAALALIIIMVDGGFVKPTKDSQ
jgi:cell volume regulation protein A